MAIISTLVNAYLARCQQKNSPEQTPAQARAALQAKYNPQTETMDSALVRQVMPQVRAAEKKARREATKEDRKNNPRMTREACYAMAEQKLIEAMNADNPAVKAAFKAAASLGDDD